MVVLLTLVIMITCPFTLDTTVVHEAQLRDHIKGKRHQKNLNYLEWERYSQSDDSARANDTTIATSTIPAAAADATQRIPTTLRSARSGVIDVVHGNEDPNDQHHIPSDPVVLRVGVNNPDRMVMMKFFRLVDGLIMWRWMITRVSAIDSSGLQQANLVHMV